jgi:hypothetical protein
MTTAPDAAVTDRHRHPHLFMNNFLKFQNSARHEDSRTDRRGHHVDMCVRGSAAPSVVQAVVDAAFADLLLELIVVEAP